MPQNSVAKFAVVLLAALPVVVKADIRAKVKPLATRVQESEKVFVGVLVNRKMLDGDWCHADLKVIQAIKGAKVGELVPVLWRPRIARYDAMENQEGLALLQHSRDQRYWLRSDTFDDVKLAEQAVKLAGGSDFERAYVQRAILSKEQEKIVLELAEKCGIKNVAKISTFNRYPTAARGIEVQGAEQIKGRDVTQRVLQVKYKDWWHPNMTPGKSDVQIGDYWAGQPTTRKQLILKVGDKEYRTRTIQGLSIEECESILGRLQTGKYTCEQAVNQDSLTRIDWSKPQGFRKRDNGISISFLHKREGGGFFELELTRNKKELTINQIMQAVP